MLFTREDSSFFCCSFMLIFVYYVYKNATEPPSVST